MAGLRAEVLPSPRQLAQTDGGNSVNRPEGTFARLFSECQAYEARLTAQGVLVNGAMAEASFPQRLVFMTVRTRTRV